MAEPERQLLQALFQLPRLWPGAHSAAVSTEAPRQVRCRIDGDSLHVEVCGVEEALSEGELDDLLGQGWLPGDGGVWERRWLIKETPIADITGELCRLAIMAARPRPLLFVDVVERPTAIWTR